MLALSSVQRYFLYRGATDIRKGIDGLSGIVRNELKENPLSGDVFIFFNRKRTHIKLLMWDRDGYAIYYKRLERGVFEIPTGYEQSSVICSQTLSLILQGIVLSSVRRRKRYVLAR
jgi:transposase